MFIRRSPTSSSPSFFFLELDTKIIICQMIISLKDGRSANEANIVLSQL